MKDHQNDVQDDLVHEIEFHQQIATILLLNPGHLVVLMDLLVKLDVLELRIHLSPVPNQMKDFLHLKNIVEFVVQFYHLIGSKV
jgi:hypothetical protein